MAEVHPGHMLTGPKEEEEETLVIQHTRRMRLIILSSVDCVALQNLFHILS